MADGSIRIDTKIDNKGVKAGLNELTSSLKNTKSKIKDTFNSFSGNTVEEQFKNISQEASRSSKAIESEMNKSNKSVDSLGEKLRKTENELKSVESQMDAIADEAIDKYSILSGKISDTQYDALIQQEIDSNTEYQKLIEKQKELTTQTEIYQSKLENAKNKVTELKAELEASKQVEQQQNAVKNINSQVGQEINASKILDGVTTQEQYNKKLEETKAKLNEIEQLTTQIANQQANGNVTQAERLKQKALETNTEYQKLQAQLQALQKHQGKYTNEVKKTAKAQKDANNYSKAISKGISGGIKSLAKYTLALLSIRSIYNILSRASNAWLNSTDSAAKQLKANFEYMSYAVGSAFKPVLTWIQNALYKILSIIASIIKTFTGVNIFANAGAKAYSSMADSASSTAKSTKEVKNNLASFDDIEVLPDNNNADTGGGAGRCWRCRTKF